MADHGRRPDIATLSVEPAAVERDALEADMIVRRPLTGLDPPP
jgi:hypothetical protein